MSSVTSHQQLIISVSLWQLITAYRNFYMLWTFVGPCIANIFSSITNEMQRYTIYLFLWNALHVSGGSSAHHQDLKNCIYNIRYFVMWIGLHVSGGSSVHHQNLKNCIYNIGYSVKPLLLPATAVAGSSKGLTKYLMLYIQFWDPYDGQRNRLKHVEHFTEIINCVTLHLVGYNCSSISYTFCNTDDQYLTKISCVWVTDEIEREKVSVCV